MKAMNDEPMTPLGEGMAQLHEVYVSLLDGGFTQDEALKLVANILLGKNGE